MVVPTPDAGAGLDAAGDAAMDSSVPDAGAGQLAARPSMLDFGAVVVGDVRSLAVVLENVGEAPVRVAQLNVEQDTTAPFAVLAPDLPLVLAGSATTTLTVSHRAADATSDLGTLKIITADGATSRVPLSAEFRGSGLVAGQHRRLPLPIVSLGLASGSSGDFSIQPTTLSPIPARSSAALAVRYAPQSAGVDAAALLVISAVSVGGGGATV